MDEKRKLEKVLFDDIERAISAYNGNPTVERGKLEDSVLKNAPAPFKKLLAEYIKNAARNNHIEAEMDRQGYGISRSGSSFELRLSYSGNRPKALTNFDVETRKRCKSLEELKRTYTLKLFAGGEHAQELFATLAKELADIVK